MFQKKLLRLSEERFGSLCWMLDEYFRQGCQEIRSGRHRKMRSLASAYISGIPPLTLNYTADGYTMIIEITNVG